MQHTSISSIGRAYLQNKTYEQNQNGAIFILHFTEADDGYKITCINDKSVEPMRIYKRDDAWELEGVPNIIRPLMTEKIAELVEEYLHRNK